MSLEYTKENKLTIIVKYGIVRIILFLANVHSNANYAPTQIRI